MTYRDLMIQLALWSDAQLDCDVTLYQDEIDEYLPATVKFAKDEGVLDKGHPFFIRK